ncbi:ankyrin repeat domain-containing protein [Legionella cardiaca]|uniref:Ankyrin repeat domain-containing protein n=1 Tax=Legionella cardiaca TaxID=1071983 RepID=A0ABY8AU04_9GAMM|nr:ankyrin repeat domain-containing protein [Legionella cardiaca]WED44148.1 ankyrin repeat domain-containing protein [Legionella cardiaca]
MHHYQLMRIAHTLGYKDISEKGMCHGFSSMWAQAACSQSYQDEKHSELDSFLERLAFLEKFANAPEKLKEKVDEVRAYVQGQRNQYNSKNLTSEQRILLEIPAFFEGVSAYQYPDRFPQLFGKKLQQPKVEEVSAHFQSQRLEESGGLVQAFHTSDQYSVQSLAAHLDEISQQLSQSPNPSNTSVMLAANSHAVSVQIVGKNQFKLMDTNHMDEYGRIFNSTELAKKLNNSSYWNEAPWHSFLTGKKPLVLKTSIFTNGNNPINLEGLKKTAPINKLTPDADGRTVMHHAAVYNDVTNLRRLDFDSLDVNQKDAKGSGPFDLACFHGAGDTVDFFLNDPKASAKLDVRGSHSLVMAAANGHFDIIDKLSQHPRFGSDARASGNSLFTIFAFNQSDAAVSYFHKLVELGENINASDSLGCTALYHVCRAGNEKMAALFLENGADINEGTPPPLMAAIQSGNANLVNMLLEKGANCAPLNNATNPLHIACLQGNREIVEKLLKKPDIDCNFRTTGGETPLITACRAGHTLLIPLLLPRTELSIADISANSPLLQEIDKCKPDVQFAFLSKALETYINTRDTEKDYHNKLNVGFSKDEKKEAAQALLDELNGGPKVNLRDYPALKDGRLFNLYDLYDRIAAKRQVFSPSTILNNLGGRSKLVTSDEVAKEPSRIENNNAPPSTLSPIIDNTYKKPTPFETTLTKK